MNWALLAGSLAAVLALAGIAALLRLGGAQLSGVEEARAIAETRFDDFEVVEGWVSTDGEAALLTGSDGTVVVLRRHGAHFVTRRVASAAIVRNGDDGDVAIDIGEARPVPLRMPDRETAEAVAAALARGGLGTQIAIRNPARMDARLRGE